jgi:hypothetical protein
MSTGKIPGKLDIKQLKHIDIFDILTGNRPDRNIININLILAGVLPNSYRRLPAGIVFRSVGFQPTSLCITT